MTIKIKISITGLIIYFYLISLVSASDEGLVAHYNFDEDKENLLRDLSGNVNNGVIYGAKWIDGISGNALKFDGATDYVDISDSASLDIANAIALEAWIKPSAFTHQYPGIVMKWDWKSGVPWQRSYSMYLSSAKPWFMLSNDGAWHDESQLESTTALSTDTWYHLAFTYDGSVMRVYINGAQDCVKSATLTIWDGSADVSIGASLTEGAVAADEETFNGTIDEVRISNTARSADWIQTEFNNQSSPSTFFSVGSEEPAP